MPKLQWDFERMSQFIAKIRRRALDMQDEQIRLEKSYLDIGSKWSDTIYSEVGASLCQVAGDLRRIFQGIRNTLIEADRTNRLLSEYNNTPCRPLQVDVPDFKTNLTGETVMQKNNIQTDSEALIGFCADLRRYIAETRSTVAAIATEHRNMSDAWSGPQYNEFGEIISEVKRRMDINLSTLEMRNSYIMHKAQIFEEVLKRSINGFNK